MVRRPRREAVRSPGHDRTTRFSTTTSAGATASGSAGDAMDAPSRWILGTRFAEVAAPPRAVRGREIEVDRASRAQLQELDLNLPDAATDLENRRLLDAFPLEEGEQPQSRLIESALLCSALRLDARCAE